MGYIEIKENISPHHYIKDNLASLPHLSVVRTDYSDMAIWSYEKGQDLMMSVIVKDFKQKQDVHKLLILSDCAVAGLLDRYGVKAQIKWPCELIVDDQTIAKIAVENLDNDFALIDFYIHVNSLIYMSMKKKTGKNYSIKTMMISMMTYFKIYYNLYQQNSYSKILAYANDIAYYKGNKDYQNYGIVSFSQLDVQGHWGFTDQQYHEMTLIEEETIC